MCGECKTAWSEVKCGETVTKGREEGEGGEANKSGKRDGSKKEKTVKKEDGKLKGDQTIGKTKRGQQQAGGVVGGCM